MFLDIPIPTGDVGDNNKNGVELIEAPVNQALNTAKTYTGLEKGKAYTYIAIQTGTRDCTVGSVTNGTYTEKDNQSSSSMSYSIGWIVPTDTSITVNMSSTSSGTIVKMLLG